MIRNTNETRTIEDIRFAMILHRPVTLDYEKADGTRTVRVVEPFEIVDRDLAAKRPFFRATDRQSRDYRSFRFDRIYAYRVASARGRFVVAVPVPRIVPPPVQAAPVVDMDAEWGDWLERTYDPDAPIPYLPTPYALSEHYNEEN